MAHERVIDTIIHHYTGKQILHKLLVLWQESTDEPVILLTLKGEAEWKINAIRVSLSKERKRSGTRSYYGLLASDAFPWTHPRLGYKVEAVVIRYTQSKSQKISFAFDTRVMAQVK